MDFRSLCSHQYVNKALSMKRLLLQVCWKKNHNATLIRICQRPSGSEKQPIGWMSFICVLFFVGIEVISVSFPQIQRQHC